LILVEDHPQKTEVAKYIDRYQLFIIEKKSFLKTVPNGKIELFTVIKGGFEQWNHQSELFEHSSKIGFIPATNRISFIHIPESIVCLNIKFNINVLGLSYFEGFLSNGKSDSVFNFISKSDHEILTSAITENPPSISIEKLDQILFNSLKNQIENKEITELIYLIEADLSDEFKVTELANKICISPKTLERRTRKYFNLSPKDLWKVIRFGHVTAHIKNSDKQRLVDALSFGYYDQSHFTKECKKITGYSPKDFFSKLKLTTSDLILDNYDPTIK
jgi:AraC-like DNA-binding protein